MATYPVAKLIAEAFYTSGIVSRQFQTVAGDQESTAFDKLNEILTDTTIESDMIPYYNTGYDFTLVPSQEKYFIPNLSRMETFTFYIGPVRYSTRMKQKDAYFGTCRAENVYSLPFEWHIERCLNGMNLFLYFSPQSNYPAQITGWFGLPPVQLHQDLASPIATADLGYPIVTGTGMLGAGELVVNNVDLAGTYATPAALAAYINTRVIPYVSASIYNGHFILTNISNGIINVRTQGNQGNVSNVTFTNFSTVNGPLDQTYNPIALDMFYINYLQYRLAERLCIAYNFAVPAAVQKQLLTYMEMISNKSSPMDLSLNKISTLSGQSSINYAQVNWGRGWTP